MSHIINMPADETKASLGGVCGGSTRRFDVIL
nr:MAG TPA: PspC domain [Caudoviricetes sp.]